MVQVFEASQVHWTIPFAALLDWRNEHGVSFVEKEGKVWVSSEHEHLLTDDLRQTIEDRQENLRDFVPNPAVEFLESVAELAK